MDIDYPHVRSSVLCPLCEQQKDIGSLVCWSCYRAYDLRYGNAEADLAIQQVEDELNRQVSRSA